MNNGVYALPGFMAPAAKNWKSQLLTNEDGSVKLCVYVGKPGTKVYYSLGIPGWKWGFIKDAQYFIDKGYPEDVIKEVSKFADYLEEEVPALPEGTVIPDIIINGWPLPITESPVEGKVYWILNIPKFVLPAGDTEVQISANGKLLKYTITRPDFSIHYNDPGYTIPAGIPGGGSGGSSTGGLTANERELLLGAAQRDDDNTFTAGNTFTGSVDMSGAVVTPPEGWNVEGVTPEQVQAVVPMAWSEYTTPPSVSGVGSIVLGDGAVALNGSCVVIGYGAKQTIGWGVESIIIGHVANGYGNQAVAIGRGAHTRNNYASALGYSAGAYGEQSLALGSSAIAEAGRSISVGLGTKANKTRSLTVGAAFSETVDGQNVTHACTTEGTGSITIGAGANTLNNGTTESSNSITIGCKALNQGADSVVIGAQASGKKGGVTIGSIAENAGGGVVIGNGAKDTYGAGVAIGTSAAVSSIWGVAIGDWANAAGGSISIGHNARCSSIHSVAIGQDSIASRSKCIALGEKATVSDYGAVVFRSTAEDGTYTQLYFSGANTPLANTYADGEAIMGYVTSDKNGNPLASGFKRLSALFDEGTMTQPATLDEFGEWVQPKVFHPSDLDMPIEEPTEPEEYTPLPVYPIVEPEIEDINLINVE